MNILEWLSNNDVLKHELDGLRFEIFPIEFMTGVRWFYSIGYALTDTLTSWCYDSFRVSESGVIEVLEAKLQALKKAALLPVRPRPAQKETLGGFLKEFLQQKHLSNREFAAKAGISESVVRNLLKHGVYPDAKNPDIDTLRIISEAHHINMLKLLYLSAYISHEDFVQNVPASAR